MTLAAPAELELAAYPDGEGFLLRPVLSGMVGYEQIDMTNLDLADFAQMNEALDVDAFNRGKIDDANRPRKA